MDEEAIIEAARKQREEILQRFANTPKIAPTVQVFPDPPEAKEVAAAGNGTKQPKEGKEEAVEEEAMEERGAVSGAESPPTRSPSPMTVTESRLLTFERYEDSPALARSPSASVPSPPAGDVTADMEQPDGGNGVAVQAEGEETPDMFAEDFEATTAGVSAKVGANNVQHLAANWDDADGYYSECCPAHASHAHARAHACMHIHLFTPYIFSL